MNEVIETKICKKCNVEYGVECFYKAYKRVDGSFSRNTVCKYCLGVNLPEISAPIKLTKLEMTLSAREKLKLDIQARKNERLKKLKNAIQEVILDSTTSKQCTKCKINLPLRCFGIRKDRANNPTSSCKFCQVKAAMDYSLKNKDKSREADKRYYANNRDKFLSREAKDRRNILGDQYRLRNPEKDNNNSSYRRAVKLRATPSWSNPKYIQLFFDMAYEERIKTGGVYHVDHIVPLRSKYVCGLHCEDNLQVLYCTLNHEKSNSTWPGMSEITKELKQLMKEYDGTN